MPYSSTAFKDFCEGDILCFRVTPDTSLPMRLSSQAQQALHPSFKQGHQGALHMAIVCDIDENDHPILAHITGADEDQVKAHENYKDREVLGMPIIETHHKNSFNDPMLVIRSNNFFLRKKIANKAREMVKNQLNRGTRWTVSNAFSTLSSAIGFSFFDSSRSNSPTNSTSSESIQDPFDVMAETPNEYTKDEMICTQFVADVLRQSCADCLLPLSENFNVPTKSAMPRVIEHVLKSQHADKYSFFINYNPNQSLPLNILDTLENLARKNKAHKPVLNLIVNLYNEFNEQNQKNRYQFDLSRLMLFFTKEMLVEEDYRPLHLLAKSHGIYREDIDFMEILAEDSQLFTDKLTRFEEKNQDNEQANLVFAVWHSRDALVKADSLDPELEELLLSFHQTIRTVAKQGHEKFTQLSGKHHSQRTAPKEQALLHFVEHFKSVVPRVIQRAGLSTLLIDLGEQLQEKLEASARETDALSNRGETKALLKEAISDLKTVINHIRPQADNAPRPSSP